MYSELQRQKLESIPIEDRRGKVIPIKFDAMRKIPAYDRFIHERFERCLDLYLLPRIERTRSIVNPKDLLPKLPDLNTLKPFPEILCTEYKGHFGTVRCLSISPCGTWLVTGSDDGTVRIWEIDTGREYWRHSFAKDASEVGNNRIEDVAFCPVPHRPLLAVLFFVFV